MDKVELQELQTPLKDRYRDDAGAAQVVLSASAALSDGIACSVRTGKAIAEAGLHPAAGGDGTQLCSGDMLLEALAACAGVDQPLLGQDQVAPWVLLTTASFEFVRANREDTDRRPTFRPNAILSKAEFATPPGV